MPWVVASEMKKPLNRFWFLISAVLLLLGGCATEETAAPEWAGGGNEGGPSRLLPFGETAKFLVRWQFYLGVSEANLLQPAITNDAVYGVSEKGGLTRLERATGQQVWHVETGVNISGGAGFGEGLVLVGSNKGEVLAYDELGQLRWNSTVSSEVLSAPQATQGMVVVRSSDGRIAGLNVEDGRLVWSYERATPALVVRSHTGVTLRDGVAFAGFAGGKLVAIRVADGMLLWEATVSQPHGNTELDRISDVTSNPVLDGSQVCAAAFQGNVACFDAVQGTLLWSREISSDKGLVSGAELYLSDDKGVLYALDKMTGSTVWKNDQLLLREASQPGLFGGAIIVGDYEGYLHALNREDGSMAARTKLEGGAIAVQPVEVDGGLLVQTRTGMLYFLSLY
jgi:outer membrane protein assembly factor BamB